MTVSIRTLYIFGLTKITDKCIVRFLHLLFLSALIYIVHNNDYVFRHTFFMCIVCFWIAENYAVGGNYYCTFYTTISVNVCTHFTLDLANPTLLLSLKCNYKTT